MNSDAPGSPHAVPRLPPCPDTPNCACSQATDPRHRVAPLIVPGSAAEGSAGESSAAEGSAARSAAADISAAALRALRRLPGARVVVVLRDHPLHARAACTTRFLRFVDDLEICLDEDRGILDVRSASRVGHWDFGTNRRRVERLRALFREELADGGRRQGPRPANPPVSPGGPPVAEPGIRA